MLGIGIVCGAGALAALALVAAASPARAQVSGSATIASDFRYRGLSLADARGALVLGAAYDHPSGLYAGGEVVLHDPRGAPPRMLGHIVYAGFATESAAGPTWDVGVSHVRFEPRLGARPFYIDFTQAYVGVAQDDLSARLSLAPNYPDHGVTTAYAELNAAIHPATDWRITGHAGAQLPMGGGGYDERYDLSLGVVRAFPQGELALSWTQVLNRPRPRPAISRPGLLVSASLYF